MGDINYGAFDFRFDPFAGYTTRSKRFEGFAGQTGLVPGTFEYNAAQKAYVENPGFFPWQAEENVRRAVTGVKTGRESVISSERFKRQQAEEGFASKAEAEIRAATGKLPLEKNLAQFQSDLQLRQLQEQIGSQERMGKLQYQGIVDSARIGGDYAIRGAQISGEYGLKGAELAARYGYAGADLTSGRQLEGIKYTTAAQERLAALEMAQRREEMNTNRRLKQEEFGVTRRGQDYDYVTRNRATSAGLMANTIQRRFYS
jgi:uncharacterized protein YifE (UPF0438 family)